MAWIESHQSLRQHPKTRRLSKALGVSLAATIGHLHCLWWWALDYAPDGDLTDIEVDTIADAGEWDGDSSVFINGLQSAGFLDSTMVIHDWGDYAGRLIVLRQKRAERMRQYRAITLPPRDNHVPVTLSHRDALPNPTEPNRTQPNPTKDTYTPFWLKTLREINGWDERGRPYEESLTAWVKAKAVTDDLLERSAIGLGAVQTKTLRGYENLAKAFQVRINKGYDAAPKGVTDGKSGEDIDPYIQAVEDQRQRRISLNLDPDPIGSAVPDLQRG